MFTRNISLGSKVLVEEDEAGRQDGEKDAEAEHDEVSNTLRKRRFASKVGVRSPVLLKGREEFRERVGGHGQGLTTMKKGLIDQ